MLNTPSCSVEGIVAIVDPDQTRPISSYRHNVKYTILFGGGKFCDCRKSNNLSSMHVNICSSHPGQTRLISSHRHNLKSNGVMPVVIQARLDQFLPIDIMLNTPSCSVEGIFAIVDPDQTRPISSHRHNVKYTILFGGGNFCNCRKSNNLSSMHVNICNISYTIM
jgi:hypothetical protein